MEMEKAREAALQRKVLEAQKENEEKAFRRQETGKNSLYILYINNL